MVSWGILAKNLSISSLVRKVTSRSSTFIRSRVVGSRHETCSFFRYLSQLLIVIICAFTVFTESPESASESLQASKSSFLICSIVGSLYFFARSKSGDFQVLIRSLSCGGRSESIWTHRSSAESSIIHSIKRQIWNTYCSCVFRDINLWRRR